MSAEQIATLTGQQIAREYVREQRHAGADIHLATVQHWIEGDQGSGPNLIRAAALVAEEIVDGESVVVIGLYGGSVVIRGTRPRPVPPVRLQLVETVPEEAVVEVREPSPEPVKHPKKVAPPQRRQRSSRKSALSSEKSSLKQQRTARQRRRPAWPYRMLARALMRLFPGL